MLSECFAALWRWDSSAVFFRAPIGCPKSNSRGVSPAAPWSRLPLASCFARRPVPPRLDRRPDDERRDRHACRLHFVAHHRDDRKWARNSRTTPRKKTGSSFLGPVVFNGG